MREHFRSTKTRLIVSGGSKIRAAVLASPRGLLHSQDKYNRLEVALERTVEFYEISSVMSQQTIDSDPETVKIKQKLLETARKLFRSEDGYERKEGAGFRIYILQSP